MGIYGNVLVQSQNAAAPRFGHLVTDIYQGALSTILPFLKEKLSLSYPMAGAILMTSSITSSVIQPVFGIISDKKGKAVLLRSEHSAQASDFHCSHGVRVIPSFCVWCLSADWGCGIHPEGYKTATFFTGEKRRPDMSIFYGGRKSRVCPRADPDPSGYSISGPRLAAGHGDSAVLFVVLILAVWRTISDHHEAHAGRPHASSAGA